MAKKMTPIMEAKLKFEETGLPEDELAYLRLVAEEKPEPKEAKKDDTLVLADAIIKAVNKSNSAPLRQTKQHLHKLIMCDEVILERSEKDSSRLTLVETIREGVPVYEKNLPIYNRSILGQPRAKVLIPQKDKDKFIKSLSGKIDEIKKATKE